MNKIKVGVVGVGHLGNYHLQKYQKLPGCTIVGVVDVIEERAGKAADMYGCMALSNHSQLIGLVDAVSIAVPTVSHYRVAKDFLEAGTDVLLEKPIAATIDEAEELISIADASGREFARGLASYPARDIRKIKGLRTSRIAEVLGACVHEEVVHRDNMILLHPDPPR